MTLIAPARRHGTPSAPAWFTDAVELWARQWGRHATTRWEPRVGCYVTRFARRPDDPVMALVRDGRKAEEDAGEPFYWHEWKEGVRPHPLVGKEKMVGGFVALDPESLGESGVRERLDRANLWGRGEFASLDGLADSATAHNDRLMDERRKQVRDAIAGPLEDSMRRARGHVQVGATASPGSSTTSTPEGA